MIKVVIIEDESPAQKKLANYLAKLDQNVEIVKVISTVTELINFLKHPTSIDLIFSDIELRDGNVFEAYEQFPTDLPIIFATAYDAFWMDAFENSGIAYLLKPFTFESFQKAFNKYLQLKRTLNNSQQDLFNNLSNLLKGQTEAKAVFKDFIAVKSGTSIYFLQVAEIVFISADNGVIFAYDCHAKKHLLNQNSLKKLEEILNPQHFFKINRSEIVHRKYIEQISRYNKNTISIKLMQYNVITSERSTASFNQWLGI